MQHHNPITDRLALSKSYEDRANAIKAGRGFWKGNVICNDPEECKAKRDELMAKARQYKDEHFYNNYGG